jgi:hypothetical protein
MTRATNRKGAMLARTMVALLLFAAGYGIANRHQLTHDVAYRLAVGDWRSAAAAFFFLAVQAAALFAALWLMPRRWAAAVLTLAGASILVNIGYSDLVPEPVDGAILAWMFAEARQAGAALGAFGAQIAGSAMQAALAVALFAGARIAMRRTSAPRWTRRNALAAAALVVAPSLIYRTAPLWPEGAERNIYGLAWDLATAPPPPARAAPDIALDAAQPRPDHIVWLVDESVAAEPFARLISPQLKEVRHVDFGVAAAMGHCSAPAQVALRSGVDVRRVDADTDLRRTPSIWGYARGAGYRTALIDGQTSGAPQNLLLAPELALIEDNRAMAAGVDTDRAIADALNHRMRGEGRSFTLAVLRGVHFQYRDHYPAGALPADAPLTEQYATALRWSKRDFFARLLDGIDRERVAIVYTSDHGQNLRDGALPHCSRAPVADEFRVPLIAFLPDALAARYAVADPRGGRSASQIFPATLGWMGYDAIAVAARYDNDLTMPTARYVWFGRSVIPQGDSATIRVIASDAFPGSDTAAP